MNILFCKIPWMSFYKGNYAGNDIPRNGGDHIKKYGIGADVENFMPIPIGDELHREFYCFGYVETTSINLGRICNQINLSDCESLDHVMVVFCAKYQDDDNSGSSVVGWYKDATVYKNNLSLQLAQTPVGQYSRQYYIYAQKKDCVLLPTGTRRRPEWRVHYMYGKDMKYGFGHDHLWYANANQYEIDFAKRIQDQILNYEGENWIDKFHA